jgi:hypothetical protein
MGRRVNGEMGEENLYGLLKLTPDPSLVKRGDLSFVFIAPSLREEKGPGDELELRCQCLCPFNSSTHQRELAMLPKKY